MAQSKPVSLVFSTALLAIYLPLFSISTMKTYLPLLITFALFSCQQTKEQKTTNLIELRKDSLKSNFSRRFTNSDFSDSLCNEGIDLAKELANDNNFRFYHMEGGMDSSQLHLQS